MKKLRFRTLITIVSVSAITLLFVWFSQFINAIKTDLGVPVVEALAFKIIILAIGIVSVLSIAMIREFKTYGIGFLKRQVNFLDEDERGINLSLAASVFSNEMTLALLLAGLFVLLLVGPSFLSKESVMFLSGCFIIFKEFVYYLYIEIKY